jgi:integrase/recombinase XerD
MQARGLSLRTVDHYSDTLNRVLVGFCEREGIGPKDLTKRHLEQLAAELLAGGRARQSVKTYLTAINTFLTWCHAEEGMAQLQAPRPSVPRPILDVLTGKEIEAMEDAATTTRDKLIIRLLADAGLRLGELRRLRIEDLIADGRDRRLRIRDTKSGRDRLVSLTPGVYMRLERYVRRERPECASDRVFVTARKGASGDYEPIAESTVQQLIRYLARKAGVSKRVHPHLFRHSLATELLRRGVNPIQVRDILGHTSLAMIDRVYSHLTTTDASKALLAGLLARDEDG